MELSDKESVYKLMIGLLMAIMFVVAFNSVRLSGLNDMGSALGTASLTGAVIGGPSGSSGSAAGSSSSVAPTGTPEIYGAELDVRYDDVSPYDQQKADATIKTLGLLDQQITLSGADKERYINILYTMEKGISCEYCCGAKAIIFADGEPACGCAHSYAMRGLAKYLITRHGSEYTDAQILEEVGKWKTLFFPGQMELKAQILQSQGIELNYINLASNKYRGIEQGASAGSMVGGC